MSETKTIRPTTDGGFSYCSVQNEEDVGKRRCNHVPGSVSFEVEVNQVARGLKEVVISPEYDDLDEPARLEVIKEFANTLKPMSKKKINKVLEQLQEMK